MLRLLGARCRDMERDLPGFESSDFLVNTKSWCFTQPAFRWDGGCTDEEEGFSRPRVRRMANFGSW
jgi:hypothetical protein